MKTLCKNDVLIVQYNACIDIFLRFARDFNNLAKTLTITNPM